MGVNGETVLCLQFFFDFFWWSSFFLTSFGGPFFWGGASFRGPGELGVHTGFQWACKRKGIYQRGAGCIQGRQLVLAFIRRAQKSAKESVQKFFFVFLRPGFRLRWFSVGFGSPQGHTVDASIGLGNRRLGCSGWQNACSDVAKMAQGRKHRLGSHLSGHLWARPT